MRTAKTQDDATKGFSMADKKVFQNMVVSTSYRYCWVLAESNYYQMVINIRARVHVQFITQLVFYRILSNRIFNQLQNQYDSKSYSKGLESAD